MLTEEQLARILSEELTIQTSRSGGKGGQHVNKVETKVCLSFDINMSSVLSQQQKTTLLKNYSGLVNATVIQVVSDKCRSQPQNKEDAKNKLTVLLHKLLKPVKKRIATKPGKAAKEKKLEKKKLRGTKKQLRKRITEF